MCMCVSDEAVPLLLLAVKWSEPRANKVVQCVIDTVSFQLLAQGLFDASANVIVKTCTGGDGGRGGLHCCCLYWTWMNLWHRQRNSSCVEDPVMTHSVDC